MEKTRETMCDRCAHQPICKHQPQLSCSYYAAKGSSPVKMKPRKKSKAAGIVAFVVWMVLIWALMGIAFWAGRASTRPEYVSKLPDLSDSVSAGLSPEEVIFSFYEAARLQQRDRVLSICHPDLIADRNVQIMMLLNNAPAQLQELSELSIIQAEETYHATLSTLHTTRTGSGKITLKKFNGEWRVYDIQRIL